jgi:hypothetical protein
MAGDRRQLALGESNTSCSREETRGLELYLDISQLSLNLSAPFCLFIRPSE